MRFSAAIKSLINGVSTKALALVRPIFLREQHNMRTDPIAGLTKRTPTEHVVSGVVTDFDNTTDWVKKFRVRNKVFFLIVKLAADINNPTTGQASNNDVTVVDEDGLIYRVNISIPAYKYLVEAGTRSDIQLNVHGDIVYITNRTKEVKMLEDLRPTVAKTLLHVKFAPSLNESIFVQVTTKAGVSTTASVSTGASAGQNAVNAVATNLANAINGMTNISATATGATVSITNNLVEENVTVLVSHSEVVVIGEETDDITNLPRHSPIGKVVGVKSSGATDKEIAYFRSDFDAATPAAVPNKQGTITFTENNVWGTAANVKHWSASYQVTTGIGTTATQPTVGTGLLLPFATRRVNSVSVFDNTFGSPRLEVWVDDQVNIPAANKLIRVIVMDSVTGVTIDDLTMAEVTIPVFGNADPNRYRSTTAINYGDYVAGRQYDIFMNVVAPVTATSTTIDAVVWRETSKPNEAYRIDETTMPVMLAPLPNPETGDLDYVLDVNTWSERGAGNTENNPDPEFINSTITATAIFQNRLVALTGTAIQTSETDNTSSFFRNTITQSLPSHPINIKSTAPDTIPFTRTLNHNKDLMLLSDNAQYKLDGNIPLTPQTAGLPQVASYSNITDVLPVSLGNRVFYAYSYGKSIGISEYEGVGLENFSERAVSISDEVKGYIPTNIEVLTGDSSTGTLVATNVDGQMFICDFDTEDTRAEDKRYAWSQWDSFRNGDSYRIEAIDMIDTNVTLAINHGTNIDIVTMNLSRDNNEAPPIIYLDNKYETTVDGSYRINLPANYSLPSNSFVIRNLDEDFGGTEEEYTVIDPQTLELVNQSPEKIGLGVTVGSPYLCEVVPNYIVGRDEGGKINSSTNIRILRFLVLLNNSADVTASIETPYATIPDQLWSGLISGDFNTLTNVTANTDGVFKVSFKQPGNVALLRLSSLNHHPMNISEIEYIGNYTSRGRRF